MDAKTVKPNCLTPEEW